MTPMKKWLEGFVEKAKVLEMELWKGASNVIWFA